MTQQGFNYSGSKVRQPRYHFRHDEARILQEGDTKTMTITIDQNAFTLIEARGRFPVRWEEIAKIVAYKRDLITIDQLCLTIHLHDGTSFEVQEDIEGFWAWVDALEQQLGIGAQWREAVLKPVFAENKKVIFAREG